MPSVKFAREIRCDDEAIVCRDLAVHHHEISPTSVAAYGNQCAAIATQDEIRVLNLPTAKAGGFREPPCDGVRGAFRPRQSTCSWPHSHHGHGQLHMLSTSTSLLTSLRSQWDQRGFHMPSRSWWNTSRGLRGTAYRLQCTCRQASHEVEH